jgi:Fur family ferric uptake transcriptional regulator
VKQGARERIGAPCAQAVYDIVRALHGAGLVRRIEPAGSPELFETRIGDNHHHRRGRECGRTVDLDCSLGAAPCLAPAGSAGFEIDEAELIFWGRCPCTGGASGDGMICGLRARDGTDTVPAMFLTGD